jgi:S-DNA-T family DNA segregation ATPase FtsK/SpoIIIE
VAATRSRSRPARKPPARKTAAKPKARTPRASRRRSRGAREPLLRPGQGRDLFGLALAALGLYAGLVLYLGFDGARAGSFLHELLLVLLGGAAVAAPPLLVAAGAALFLHVDPRRLRPFRLGASALLLGTLLLLSGPDLDRASLEAQGGLVGNGLNHLLAPLVGDVGIDLLAIFLLLAGAVLVSGGSLGVVVRERARLAQQSATRALRAPRRRPEPERRDRRAPETPAAPAAPAAGEAFPDVFDADTDAARAPAAGPAAAEAEAGQLALPHEEEAADGHDAALAQEPQDVEVERVASDYVLPDSSVLRKGKSDPRGDQDAERVARTLVAALAEHGVEARLVGAVSGPRVTRYELQLAPGTKVSRVSSLRDDLAYALATTEIRILAPIPGKQAVGVEVPNRGANVVALGDLVDGMPPGAGPLTVWLGKDIAGHTVVADLTRMPHLLIAGTTGSGKSGCINAMLCSVLLRATPDDVRMILIDPKKVELNHYEAIPHLLTPVVTNMKNAAAVLGNVVREMESRYEIMGLARARNLVELNRVRVRDGRPPLPYVLVVIDELADLMMVSPTEVEDAVIRLAQKSRAVGIHLVLATQRPSVDVITGMIKANVPSRIAFAVSSQTDSRVILDTAGAESLLGQGDMLYKPVGLSRLQRVQGAFISEEEIGLLVGQCRVGREPEFSDEMLEQLPDVEPEELDPDEDDLLDDAILCVAQHETASVSLLQRRLRVGYTRAGRLIDMLERRGVISGYEGSKPRRVLVSYEEAQRLAGRPAGVE